MTPEEKNLTITISPKLVDFILRASYLIVIIVFVVYMALIVLDLV